MAERRYATNRPSPRLEKGDEAPRPACDGNWQPFDALIDHSSGPVYRYALAAANDICHACPIRLACWTENAGEEWVQRLRASNATHDVPTRDCETCGTTFEIGPRQGQKRFCRDACNKASWRAAKKVA